MFIFSSIPCCFYGRLAWCWLYAKGGYLQTEFLQTMGSRKAKMFTLLFIWLFTYLFICSGFASKHRNILRLVLYIGVDRYFLCSYIISADAGSLSSYEGMILVDSLIAFMLLWTWQVDNTKKKIEQKFKFNFCLFFIAFLQLRRTPVTKVTLYA